MSKKITREQLNKIKKAKVDFDAKIKAIVKKQKAIIKQAKNKKSK